MSVINHNIFRVLEIDHSPFLEPHSKNNLKGYESCTNFQNKCHEEINKNQFERTYSTSYKRNIWLTKETYMAGAEKYPCNQSCTEFSNLHYNSVIDNRSDENYIKLEFNNNQDSNNFESEENIKTSSANVIKNFLLGVRNKNIFRAMKSTICILSAKDPVKALLIVNYIHALIFDKSTCFLIFRLDGTTFPPKIVYKLFTMQKMLVLEPHEYVIDRKDENERPSSSNWFPFTSYKCDTCKNIVRTRPKSYKRTKQKWRKNNHISWIEEIYG